MDRRTFLTWVWLGCLASVSPAMIKAGTAAVKDDIGDELLSKGLEPVVFYVALNGNDAWSGKQAAPNSAKTDGPFATLQKARDAIRKLKREQGGTLKQPVNVLLRGGTYFLSEPVVFTPEDSGTAKFPITYEAYPDEKPVISGGQKVTGWKQEGNIWKATLPALEKGSWDFLTLRVGNEWAIRSRYPNFEPKNPYKGGWLFAKNTSPSKTEVVVDPAKFPSWSDWSGAEINIFTQTGLWNAIIPISRVDKNKHTLFINSQEEILPGARFFITNIQETLNSYNEWFFNKKKNEILYYNSQDNLNNLNIIIPRLSLVIELKGQLDKSEFVNNINFRNLIISDTNSPDRGYAWRLHAAVWLTAARGCTIENCTFTRLAGYALLMNEGCQENKILSNEMTDLGQGGVLIASFNNKLLEQQHLASDNFIANNNIHTCGLLYKNVGGIDILKGSNNRVAFNRIMKMPKWGVCIAYNSHSNVIEYNEIIDTNQETKDTGAIYIYRHKEIESGNILRYNFIRNSNGLGTTADGRILSPHYSWGIYLDNYSSNTKIYGNIIVDTVRGGVFIHGGRDNVVENNILVNGLEHQIYILPIGDFMKGNKFRRNLIVFDNPKADIWYSYAQIWWRRAAPLMTECNFNLYWHTGGLDLTKEGVITQEINLARWQELGYDRNSIIGNPLFVASEKGDFRLRAESPAFKLGFEPIPIERIGPKGFNRSKETTIR